MPIPTKILTKFHTIFLKHLHRRQNKKTNKPKKVFEILHFGVNFAESNSSIRTQNCKFTEFIS